MHSDNLWSRILVITGGIAMLVGVIDPIRGSLIILPASLLFALGTFTVHSDRRWSGYRIGVIILIAIGVGAMWELTRVGGDGGNLERSLWWGILTLPYLLGWSMGIWGPGSPRWLLLLGLAVSLFYLVLSPIILTHGVGDHRYVGALVLAALGLLTSIGCIIILRERSLELNHSFIGIS
jgi:hypothetical protein